MLNNIYVIQKTILRYHLLIKDLQFPQGVFTNEAAIHYGSLVLLYQ